MRTKKRKKEFKPMICSRCKKKAIVLTEIKENPFDFNSKIIAELCFSCLGEGVIRIKK